MRKVILISLFSVLIILPLLSISVNGQNMTKDDDDFLIYGKYLFGLSIKYPVSTWRVEEGERNFYLQDEFATFCPKNELFIHQFQEKMNVMAGILLYI